MQEAMLAATVLLVTALRRSLIGQCLPSWWCHCHLAQASCASATLATKFHWSTHVPIQLSMLQDPKQLLNAEWRQRVVSADWVGRELHIFPEEIRCSLHLLFVQHIPKDCLRSDALGCCRRLNCLHNLAHVVLRCRACSRAAKPFSSKCARAAGSSTSKRGADLPNIECQKILSSFHLSYFQHPSHCKPIRSSAYICGMYDVTLYTKSNATESYLIYEWMTLNVWIWIRAKWLHLTKASQLFLALLVASPAAAAVLVVHTHDASPPQKAAALELFKQLHGDTWLMGKNCQSHASVWLFSRERRFFIGAMDVRQAASAKPDIALIAGAKMKRTST